MSLAGSKVNTGMRHLLAVSLSTTSVVEERRRRRWKANLSAVLLAKGVKTVEIELLLFNSKLNSLVTVVGNVAVAKVDKAELVFRVKFSAEG